MNEFLEWAKLVTPPLLTAAGTLGAVCVLQWWQRNMTAAGTHRAEAEADALQAKTSVELWQQLSALQSQITGLRTELARLSIENATLQAENAELKVKISAQAEEIADLRRRLNEYERRVAQAGKTPSEDRRE